MEHELQAGKNFAWGFFSQIIIRLFGLVFFVFMSHLLLEKGMGQYNFISSFVVLWFIFSDFGAGNYLYREWSKGKTTLKTIEYDFNIALSIKFVISLIIFIPFVTIGWFFNNDIFISLVLYYIVVFLSLIINQVDFYLNAMNEFKITAIRQLIEKMAVIFIGGFLLFFFKKLEVIFVSMICAQIFSIYYYFRLNKLPLKPTFVFSWTRAKYLCLKGLPFALIIVITSIYSKIDMVMLKFMKGFDAVGLYGTAYKIYDVANIFPGILLMPAIFPVLSRIVSSNNGEDYVNFLNKVTRIIFSFSLITTLLFISVAPYLVNYFFPDSFLPSVLAMRILTLGLVISAFSLLLSNLLIIQNKEKLGLKILLASASVNIFLNLILIPKYSLYGAAIATIAAEFFNIVLLQYYSSWFFDKIIFLKMTIVVFVSIIIWIFIKSVGYTNNIYITIFASFIIICVLSKLKILQKNDFNMFFLPIKNKITIMFFNKSEI